ncbi:MAG: DUF1512 family protein [Candidatus Aenigmarchaeota archaeon]|nr:DUF1512 family protein [Candidatus Aenigmarchaeota archaeon]
MLLMQALGNDNWISSIIWLILFFVMVFLYPRLMIYQQVTKLEKDIADLEKMSNSSINKIVKRMSKKAQKDLKKKIFSFLEFFVAEPVSIDPYGIVDKIHEVVKLSENREIEFVEKLSPNMNIHEKRSISAAISATSGLHQIIKIMRYYLELIKKYKILQLALILQMEMPLIKRLARSYVKATDAFVDDAPIGDGIGPLVVASMIPENAKVKHMKDEEFSYAKTKINGKTVILAKATGPGATIGYPGKFVEKLLKKEKIDRIITVDAAGAMYGEKNGVIMEGVGVGNRGGGLTVYHGFIIEEIATKKKIPIDSIGIKEVGETAIYPMKEEILKSLPRVKEKLMEFIKKGDKNEKILVIGFGNTSGIGNSKKGLEKTFETIKKKIREMKKEEEAKKKKKSSFFGISNFLGYFLLPQSPDFRLYEAISNYRYKFSY